jgi:DNA (cytosine-5)-methyltransferase 1
MLRVGTDCSGIEAPIQALQQLGIPFRHEFSCEKDKHCRDSIKANYNPRYLYDDMTTRDVRSLPPIDIYICGFPCQPFSLAGKRKGIHDEQGRGELFGYCLEVITHLRPNCIILENVKGLLSIDGGNTFDAIITSLEKLSYHMTWKVVNTKDYGIPQNRERLYMIGLLHGIDSYTWPEPIPCPPLVSYIDKYDREKDDIPDFIIRSQVLDYIPLKSCFIDIGFPYNNFPYSDRICPCLTTQGNLWCVPLQRRANCKEYLLLQGFPLQFNQVVSDRQLKKQIGNSMSVNVLKSIFIELLPLLIKNKIY